MDYRIFPPEEMIDATIELPLSKSVANRLLIINALTLGSTPLPESMLPDADDSRIMVRALDSLPGTSEINVGAAGTAFRFLTALCAATPGIKVTIDGTDRLRQRPIAPLVDTLRRLGASITYLGNEGFAPLSIEGCQLSGGSISIDPSVSSQFVSALMMIAPTMQQDLHIDFCGEEPVSRPYLRMTAAMMQRAGVDVDLTPFAVTIKRSNYRQVAPYSERDWSAASYWYSVSAISAGFVTLPHLSIDSLQGDSALAHLFEQLGVITEEAEDVEDALQLTPSPEQFSRFEHDLTDNPDLAQTLAVTAAMLGIPFHLRGLSTLRHKETDRLEALRCELDKFGIIVEIRGDNELVWNGERHPIFETPQIDTYADHRMAMAFAPAAVFIPGLVIRDIEVVSKSYPAFWDDLRSAGFILTDASIPLPDPEDPEDQE